MYSYMMLLLEGNVLPTLSKSLTLTLPGIPDAGVIHIAEASPENSLTGVSSVLKRQPLMDLNEHCPKIVTAAPPRIGPRDGVTMRIPQSRLTENKIGKLKEKSCPFILN